MTKGALYIGFSSIVFILSGYVINVWLGRYLGPIYYGDYGVIISLMSVVNLIQLSGIPHAVSKFIAEDESKTDAIFNSGLYLQGLVGILIGIFYFLFADVIASILKDRTLIPYLKESALIFPLYGIYAAYTGFNNGKNNFTKQAVMNIFYSLGKLLVIFILVLKFHLYGAIAGFILAPVLGTIPGLYFSKNRKIFFPFKKLIYFSLPLIGFALFSTLLQSIDLYFIKALIQNKENTGFYTASQNIAKISLFGLSAFSIVLFPSISKSVSSGDDQKTRNLISKSLRYMLMLILPLSFFTSFASKQIIEVLYSKAYLPAANPLSVLCIGFAFATLFNVLANILSGAGFPKIPLYISIAGLIITAILCYLFIPIFGIIGAAWATTLGSLLTLFSSGYFVFMKFNSLVSPLSLIRIFIASSVIFLLPGIQASGVISLLILLFAYLIINLLLLLLLKELTQEDKKMFLSFIPGFVKKS